MLKLLFENWRNHLSEDKQHTQVLREVTEDELGHIQRALEEMEPTDLAFNHLFGDKMRKIIDFDTIDKSTGLGKLVTLWSDGEAEYHYPNYDEEDFKWVPDFGSGTVSRLSPKDYQRKAGLMAQAPGPEKERPKKEDIRKETMKVGKFLSKGERLAVKLDAFEAQINQAFNEYTESKVKYLEDKSEAINNRVEEDRKKWIELRGQQSVVQAEMDSFMSHDNSPMEQKDWQELAKFWQQNADFLKKNPGGAESDTYKIILSRHPIDILRMSDFSNITSCHKPPSHPKYEGRRGNYYECAVAEAHGEGAMAYVVQKGVLFSETGTKTIEEAEEAINASEEIFYDQKRPESWEEQGDNSIGIIPNSRVRLRKMTYHQPEEWKDAFNLKDDAGEGTQFALPEEVIYGTRISGIVDKVKSWATESQAEQIANFPKDEQGKVLLNRFIKSGGTYGDNKPFQLMKQMFPTEEFQGRAIVDDSIETGLDLDLGGYDSQAIQRQINRISEEYTGGNLIINGEVEEDDYDEDVYYIRANVFMVIKWPESEFISLDHQFGDWVHDDLVDIELDWVDKNGRAQFNREGDEMVMWIPMSTDGILRGAVDEEGIYDIESYEPFAKRAKSIANEFYDFVKSQANRFARREGLMQGGVFAKWGWEIINGDADYYDWDATAQEGDDVDIESIDIYTTISIDDEDWYVLEAPALTGEYVAKIMNTDDFKTLLSRELFKPIFEANPDRQKYYSNRTVKAEVLNDRAASVRIAFDVYDESNDEQVENLKDVIEYWDDEEGQMNLVLGIIGKLIGSSGVPKKKEEPKEEGGLGSLKEHFRRFL